ncbi:MAG: ATP-binding protein [Rickettsiales bacterium]
MSEAPHRQRTRRGIRRFLPNNLFARALLILVLPMLLSQLFIAHIFYDRHWSSVSRNMANSVVGDVVWLEQSYRNAREEGMPVDVALAQVAPLAKQMGIVITLQTEGDTRIQNGRGRKFFPDFFRGLNERIDDNVALEHDDVNEVVRVRIEVPDGVLALTVNRKSLTSQTTTIFMLWMAGTSILMTFIATLFLRNQVRPIVTLSHVAEQLGLGHDVASFKPSGANEVRRAGKAFLVMSERIRRHVQSRTEMLAGISHDLRTPLTRMKLELELATMDAVTRTALSNDIDEMGKMIDEYLDFARGDAGELAEPIDLNQLLTNIADDYRRSKREVYYTTTNSVELMLRPQAMRRALTNLIDNALRYGGGEATLTLEQSTAFVRIKVTDIGEGIPSEAQETVFKPFTRLEPSRNTQTGGVGLGLSIARAIAQSHGGDVMLENQLDGKGKVTGLEVTLRLPRAVQIASQ